MKGGGGKSNDVNGLRVFRSPLYWYKGLSAASVILMVPPKRAMKNENNDKDFADSNAIFIFSGKN